MNEILRFDGVGARSFRLGERELARYVTERDAPALESPRPYLHPISTLGGTVVSGYRPADHDWHWGLSMAIANIDVPGEELPVNLWGGVTYTEHGYVQLDNNGDQVHEGWGEGGAESAESAERLTWRTASGRAFLRESRTFDARRLDLDDGSRRSAWRLDVTSEWTNLADGTVHFGSPTTAGRDNAGYGGWFLRAAPEFSTASVVSPSGPVDVDAAMGQRFAWLALATDSATVALAADPHNPVAESPFFVRTETPMLCAAPFFFQKWPLDAGATALWRWSLLVSDGRLDSAAIAGLVVASAGSTEPNATGV
ncbi:hypothetical protein L1277_002098 [Okibacterium sp. HSC-33S16]|uniref:DUF6807 domain-containing protein n=1 Tax=Okibacterium sp. HSC-33S16 TaxID=2910965 RepID=UPI00209D52C8|nr:DUF6807 family protein [Okibacterium sp. HSC-33S16]MCP2031999.1 hypothetical protein [Okibacterium sp. HSC-33S16]